VLFMARQGLGVPPGASRKFALLTICSQSVDYIRCQPRVSCKSARPPSRGAGAQDALREGHHKTNCLALVNAAHPASRTAPRSDARNVAFRRYDARNGFQTEYRVAQPFRHSLRFLRESFAISRSGPGCSRQKVFECSRHAGGGLTQAVPLRIVACPSNNDPNCGFDLGPVGPPNLGVRVSDQFQCMHVRAHMTIGSSSRTTKQIPSVADVSSTTRWPMYGKAPEN
jgi:hypothetical protein